MQDTQFQSLGRVGKIPWNRKWQPTPVFLPGNFHRWRNLAGYSPWDHKTSDMTEMHVCPSLPDSSSFCGGNSLQSDRKQSFFSPLCATRAESKGRLQWVEFTREIFCVWEPYAPLEIWQKVEGVSLPAELPGKGFILPSLVGRALVQIYVDSLT